MCGEGPRETVSCLEKGTQTSGNKDRGSWNDLGLTLFLHSSTSKLFGNGLFVPRPILAKVGPGCSVTASESDPRPKVGVR